MKRKVEHAAPLAALLLGLASAAVAQPVIQQGNAQNPQNLQIGGPGGGPGGQGGPGGRGGGFGGPGGGFGGPGGGFGGDQMTPEEQQQMMAQFRETRLRRQLAAANADPKAQDAVVQYSKAQDAATQKIQDLMRQLVEAVSTKGTPDDKIATLLKQLEDATAAEKARRQTARTALDAQTGYSKNARLNGLLTTMGLVGDESLMLGNVQGANGGMMGNMMGGRGGGFGGPGGGPGGGFGGPGGGFGGPGGGPGGGFGGPGGQGGPQGGPPGGPPPGQ